MRLEKELWMPFPAHLSLDPTTAHVWRVNLDIHASDVQIFKQVLSTDEKLRAERLIDDERRNNFISARAQLRFILGRYMQISPAKLRFDYNAQGKPSLVGHSQKLFFNLSHSQSLMVVLISQHEFCGVDLEWIDPLINFKNVAKKFFTSVENQQLGAFPQNMQRRCFFRIWTRKEAVLKALGDGFSAGDLTSVVDLKHCLICSLLIRKDYVCSLAIKTAIDRIERYNVSSNWIAYQVNTAFL